MTTFPAFATNGKMGKDIAFDIKVALTYIDFIVTKTIKDDVIEQADRLDTPHQRKVLDFARRSTEPVGTPGEHLMRFAGCINPADLDVMSRAIEEGCEKIDPNAWQNPFRHELRCNSRLKVLDLLIAHSRDPRSSASTLQGGNFMPLAVPRVSTSTKILMVATCVLACAWFQTPPALAQHVGHAGGGVHPRAAVPVGAPRVAAPRASRPMSLRSPNAFSERPLLILRRPFFLRAPFLWSWQAFNSSWWLYCGPVWGWNSGCDDLFYSAHTTEHYLAPPLTYASPVYIYSLDGHQLVQLYLKDGTAYSVNDYWFVDKDVHFTLLNESATKSVEQVISFDDLDVQKTIDVNSRRGFRVVMRSEPLEQYLRDHPDLTPPPLEPPQKN
jgi:hypothetical protein